MVYMPQEHESRRLLPPRLPSQEQEKHSPCKLRRNQTSYEEPVNCMVYSRCTSVPMVKVSRNSGHP
jgi:hypothetical protein